jgi:hypothetical protein
MKVLGHDYVSQDDKAITHSRLFQNVQEEVAAPRAVEPTMPLITAASDEVEVAVMVEALQVLRHRGSVATLEGRKL